jgi:hypothetical protein
MKYGVSCQKYDCQYLQDDRGIVINYDDYTKTRPKATHVLNISNLKKENEQLKQQIEKMKHSHNDILEDYWYLLRMADEGGKLLKVEKDQYYNKIKKLKSNKWELAE